MGNVWWWLLSGGGVFGVGGVGVWQALSNNSQHEDKMSSYREASRIVKDYISSKNWNWIEMVDPEDGWWRERWKILLGKYGVMLSPESKRDWSKFRDECFSNVEGIKAELEKHETVDQIYVLDNDYFSSNEDLDESLISKYICLNNKGED